METAPSQIAAHALALPPAQRAELAAQLLGSLEHPGAEASAEQLGAELRERLEQHRRGELPSQSLDEARDAINARLRGQ